MKKFVLMLCLVLTTACTAQHKPGPLMVDESLKTADKMEIAVLPFRSLTGNVYAGHAVAGVFASEIYARKVFDVMEESRAGVLLSKMKWQPERMGETKYAKEIARNLGVDAVLYGQVIEYGYKVSLHEEPAVGVTLRLVTDEGKVLWAASNSSQGGSVVRESLGLTVHELARFMVKRLERNIKTP